jgi:two-component system, OmpR family, sensor histidine kinase BaeS
MARVFAANLTVVAVAALSAILAGWAFAPLLLERHVESMMRMSSHGPGFERMAADLDAAYRAALGQSIAWAVAIASLAAVGVAWTVTNRLIRPLQALRDASTAIAAGRRGERLEEGAPGEIGELAASFNAMAAALDDADAVRRRLVNDLAHELRTPVSNLHGYLEALEDGVFELDDATRGALRRQVERLARLVTDLGALHDLEAGQVPIETVRTELAELVRSGAAAVQARFAERGVALSLALPTEDAWVDADAVRTGQVLENLLDNALRHTPSGGSVTVGVTPLAAAVRVEVRDTGPGVAEGERDAVFRRFYRGDPARSPDAGGGSGVGLTIAKALVERQGGAIGVDAAPEGGARFWFTLPADAPRA